MASTLIRPNHGHVRSPVLTRMKLQLLNQLRCKTIGSGNLLNQGFTLVELMIVTVIVGILAAVAIPNYLAQTDKAKATEAKTEISATIKQAQAQFVEDGNPPYETIDKMNEYYKTPLNEETNFNYRATWVAGAETPNGIYTVVATGNGNDKSITGRTITGCVQFGNGVVEIQSMFDTEVKDCPEL